MPDAVHPASRLDLYSGVPDVRELFGAALDAPCLANLVHFASFAVQFRRHSTFNANLIRIQRPGARAVASRAEWEAVGRWVIPDAVPILLLWPSAPVILAFDVEDTGPPIDRAEIGDPFGVTGAIDNAKIESALSRLRWSCARDPHFRVEFVKAATGFGHAGSAARVGHAPEAELLKLLSEPAENITWAGQMQVTRSPGRERIVPLYRVAVNRRLSPAEQMVTLAHELGHIFLGHLGPCAGDAGERAGWPDRRDTDRHVAEMEAEAVAWIVAARAGLVTNSATYLARHVTNLADAHVNVSLVERAAGRVERAANMSSR